MYACNRSRKCSEEYEARAENDQREHEERERRGKAQRARAREVREVAAAAFSEPGGEIAERDRLQPLF